MRDRLRYFDAEIETILHLLITSRRAKKYEHIDHIAVFKAPHANGFVQTAGDDIRSERMFTQTQHSIVMSNIGVKNKPTVIPHFD